MALFELVTKPPLHCIVRFNDYLCISVVFNGLNSVLMPILYQKFQHDDQYLFEKCKILAGMNVTAEQFGGSEDFAIHFTAAASSFA